MENFAIVNFQPGDYAHIVAVFNNEGEKLFQTTAPAEDLNNCIKAVVNKFEIKKVRMNGSKLYLEKFATELKNEYSMTDVDIVIL